MNKIKRLFVLSLLLLCTAACEGKSSPEVVEKAFEDSLGIDIPSNFRVVENVWYSNIDYSASYTIEFTPDVFEFFVQQIDMKKWRSDYKDVYDFVEPERNGVTIQMYPESRRLSYIYSK